MLDVKDLQAIRGIVKGEVGTAIEDNNVIILEKVGGMIKESGEQIMHTVGSMIKASEQRVIYAVGEMIEENIIPQLAVINRRLDQHDKILGWQQ